MNKTLFNCISFLAVLAAFILVVDGAYPLSTAVKQDKEVEHGGGKQLQEDFSTRDAIKETIFGPFICSL